MITRFIKKVFNLFLSKEFMVFLSVGAIASLVNFMGGFLFRAVFTGKYFYTISICLGYLLGSAVSFLLNKMVTFKAHDEKVINQITKYIIVLVVSIAIASGIANTVMIIYHRLKIDMVTVEQMESIARLLSIGLTTIFNYPAIKFFSFKKITQDNKQVEGYK